MRVDLDALRDQVPLKERCAQLGIILDSSGTALCPKRCSAHRRAFHITNRDRWACRYCHQEYGDVIELERWLTGCSFGEALSILVEGRVLTTFGTSNLPAKKRLIQEMPEPAWQKTRREVIYRSRDALEEGPTAARQRDYLVSRGISLETAGVAYLVGAVKSPLGPAISLPHISERGIHALKGRMLDGEDRFRAEPGSRPYIFGAHHLYKNPVLIATEGELNALSIATALGKDAAADVISFGAEDKWPVLGEVIGRYESVLVWLDKPGLLPKLVESLRHSSLCAIASPKDMDANDLLTSSSHGSELLKGFVERKVAIEYRRQDGMVSATYGFEFE
jgi:hypothetical protein